MIHWATVFGTLFWVGAFQLLLVFVVLARAPPGRGNTTAAAMDTMRLVILNSAGMFVLSGIAFWCTRD